MPSVTLPTDRAFVADLALALHRGRTWEEIAEALGARAREVRTFYRSRARRHLLRLLDQDPDVIRNASLGSVAFAIENVCGFTIEQLRSRTRTAELDQARRVFAHVARHTAHAPWEEIGRHLRRHHTTPLAAAGFVAQALQHDRMLRRLVHKVTVAADGHGTSRRYGAGPCYPDGRHCEPCLVAHGALIRASREEAVGAVRLPTDPETVQLIAKRLHAGETWYDLAHEAGRTRVYFQRVYRERVQPHCLELVNRDDPPDGRARRAHGTCAKYVVEQCRCEPCTYARVLYHRERLRKKRKGLEPYVDAAKAREHVRWLMDNGVGLKRVAKASGVAHGTLSKLIYGERSRPPTKRIRVATGRKIMAVTLKDRADGAYVDGARTLCLVELLVQRGWTRRAIAEVLGQRGGGLQLGRGGQVTAGHARAVDRLWRESPDPPEWARRRTRWTPASVSREGSVA